MTQNSVVLSHSGPTRTFTTTSSTISPGPTTSLPQSQPPAALETPAAHDEENRLQRVNTLTIGHGVDELILAIMNTVHSPAMEERRRQ